MRASRDTDVREAREAAVESLLSGGERVSKGRQRGDREESPGLCRRLSSYVRRLGNF